MGKERLNEPPGIRNRDITQIHSLRENRIANMANGKWQMGRPADAGKREVEKVGGG